MSGATRGRHLSAPAPAPGTGALNTAIPDYDTSTASPWASLNPSAVYIAAGVTGVGKNAFNNPTILTNITFEDASDLTHIGMRAFSGDGRAAFTDEGNTGDTSTLNLSNVKTMGEYAFSGCSRLTGVTLAADITAVETKEGGAGTENTPHKLPKGAFSGTGLTEVTFIITSQPAQPVTGLDLTVDPDQWTYGDGTEADISVTFDGSRKIGSFVVLGEEEILEIYRRCNH